MKNETPHPSSLKIAHYNIWSGGVNRMDQISRVIKEINPDICGLLECVGWEDNIDDYKNKFKIEGYDYFYFAKANSKYNIAVISKIKLEPTIIRDGIRHVILVVKIENPSLNIYFIHLSPALEDDRMKELAILLKNVSKLSNSIIMGDFNSLSFRDNYNDKELLNSFKMSNITKYGDRYLRFDLINTIEKEKFVDAFKYTKNNFDYSVPTKSNVEASHKEKIRIDYAFVKENILDKIISCKIFKSEIAEKASDHYPLYIEIEKSSGD